MGEGQDPAAAAAAAAAAAGTPDDTDEVVYIKSTVHIKTVSDG